MKINGLYLKVTNFAVQLKNEANVKIILSYQKVLLENINDLSNFYYIFIDQP